MLGPKKETKSINFLEPVGNTDSVVYTSFSWLTTIGKTLLMIVQIVVLIVFVSRLIMDGKNNDLTTDINAQVKVLENDTWKKSVIKYENLQDLLGDIKVIQEGQDLNSNLISEIISAIPITLNVQNISINNGRVSISLTTSDFKALKDYEDALKNNTYYSNVKFSIVKTGADFEVAINFEVSEEVK